MHIALLSRNRNLYSTRRLVEAAEQRGHTAPGLMKTQEYNLESGTPVNGVYGIGSRVGRVLAGGLAKRYKYNLSVSDGDDGEVVLSLTPAMHGGSGGIIGASKLKKETKRLIALIDDSMAKD